MTDSVNSDQNLQRLRSRHEREAKRFSAVLSHLSTVLSPDAVTSALDHADEKASAILRIAAALGQKAHPVNDVDPALKLEMQLTELAEQQSLRLRRVMLKSGWQRDALYCLVTHFNDELVSLIPTSDSSYQIVFSDRPPMDVSEEMLVKFSDTAYAVYPQLEGEASVSSFIKLALWKSHHTIWTVCGLLVMGSILGIFPPMVIKYIVGTVIPFNETTQLPIIAVTLVLAGAGLVLFKLLASLSVLKAETSFDTRVQSAVWSHLLRLPVSFFRSMPTGALSVKVQSIDEIRTLLSTLLTQVASGGGIALASFLLMFFYQQKLATPVLFLALIFVSINMFVGRRISRLTADNIEAESAMRSSSMQFLQGVTKLRSAYAEKNAFSLWAPIFEQFIRINKNLATSRSVGLIAASAMPTLMLGVLILAIGFESKEIMAAFKVPSTWDGLDVSKLLEAMPAATFVAFFMAATQFIASVKILGDCYTQLVEIRPHILAVKEVLDVEPEVHSAGESPGELRGSLEISNVDFRYVKGGPQVLYDVSIAAAPGQFIALVGPSGAGKSSLIRLILGFDEPETGTISVDNKNIANMNKRLLRRQFGVVLQDSQTLPGSIYDNIAAGTGISIADAWEAARLAGFDEDIKSMPMQMHTVLAEGAATLSGGQKQRLIIARALARNPAYILFDEATSALDNKTQAIVSESLEKIGCTRIVIAHRLSTIIGAEIIYVLDRGRVVESGSYSDLIAQNGLFSELASRQTA